MFRLPVVAIALGVCLLRADTLTQISIDFHEFDVPLGFPVDVGNYYAGGTASGTNGLSGPDYGITGYGHRWFVFPSSTPGEAVATFQLHGPGRIDAAYGLYNSVSLSIAGGLSYAPSATLPITVMDAAGNIIGETDIAYTGGRDIFQNVTIPFLGEGTRLNFGDLNSLDAGDYNFTDLVTWVNPQDTPAGAPEPRYAFAMGAMLLFAGAIKWRKRAAQ